MLTLTKSILTNILNNIKKERLGRIPYRTEYILTEGANNTFIISITDGYFDRKLTLPQRIDYAQVTLRNMLEQYWEEAEYEILNFHENNTSI